MRIGILSFAHVHAGAYVGVLRQLPGVDLLGFWDDGEGAQSVAEHYGLPLFPTAQALLAARPDAVIVCSETSRHRELVELAASAGAHVLCEKPIATTLEDAQVMREACERHGVLFMTAFPMRFDSSCLTMHRAVQAGELGPILGVNGVNHSEDPSRHRAWFADPLLSGGGALMDHVVHLADLLRWSFGCEVSQVYASVRYEPHEAGPLDTAGLLLLTMANGVQASIDCSWNRPPSYPRWGHLKLDVVGERSLLVVDAFADHLTLYSEETSPIVTWPGYGVSADTAMLRAFLDATRTEAPPVSWNDGYQALRVVLAAYESARRGQPVTLN